MSCAISQSQLWTSGALDFVLACLFYTKIYVRASVHWVHLQVNWSDHHAPPRQIYCTWREAGQCRQHAGSWQTPPLLRSSLSFVLKPALPISSATAAIECKRRNDKSMSRVAHCTDNGPMEGFWGILKCEMYYGKKCHTREELVYKR